MNWLFELTQTNPIEWREKKIHCQPCLVSQGLKRNEAEYGVKDKCCRFSPFLSAFAIGSWIEKENRLPIFNDRKPIFTWFGISHSFEDRQNPKSLCQHYQSSTGQCGVWSERPATCFTFFCTSQWPRGQKMYSELEDFLLASEAQLLKSYFLQTQNSAILWENWVNFMEKVPRTPLAEDLIINSEDEAYMHYLKSFQWLKGLSAHHPELTLFKKNINNWLQQYQSL